MLFSGSITAIRPVFHSHLCWQCPVSRHLLLRTHPRAKYRLVWPSFGKYLIEIFVTSSDSSDFFEFPTLAAGRDIIPTMDPCGFLLEITIILNSDNSFRYSVNFYYTAVLDKSLSLAVTDTIRCNNTVKLINLQYFILMQFSVYFFSKIRTFGAISICVRTMNEESITSPNNNWRFQFILNFFPMKWKWKTGGSNLSAMDIFHLVSDFPLPFLIFFF